MISWQISLAGFLFAIVVFWIWRDIRFTGKIKSEEKRLDARVKVHTAVGQMAGATVIVFGFFLTWKQQAENSAQQVENQRQNNLTQLSDRFQRSVSFLGNSNRSIRLSGLIGLEALAKENPVQFRETVLTLISAFLRDTATRSEWAKASGSGDTWPPIDIEAAMNTISKLLTGMDGRSSPISVDLRGVVLKGKSQTSLTVLEGLFLPNVDFSDADLSNCRVRNCRLYDSIFERAVITNSSVTACEMNRCNLRKTDLTGAGWIGNRMDEAQFHGAVLLLDRGRHSETDFIGARGSKSTVVPAFWSTNHLRIELD